MIEELNKKLDILELEKIKEILPDYIHKTSKNNPPISESLNYGYIIFSVCRGVNSICTFLNKKRHMTKSLIQYK